MRSWGKIAAFSGLAVVAYLVANAAMDRGGDSGRVTLAIPPGGEVPGTINQMDLAAGATYKANDGTRKLARGNTRDNVWAIVLHQTGFSRLNDPEKYKNVVSHFVVMPDGTVIQNHPIAAYLPASGGLNNGSVAVEFVGNFPSVSRSTDPGDFWNPDNMGMDQLTAAQVEAGRNLVYNLRNSVFPHKGWTLDTVLAHRQSYSQRGNDPGPDVWGAVGAWAVNQLGMGWGGPDFSVGTGKPIPSHWWASPAIA